MVKLRAEKVARVAESLPPCDVDGQPDDELLVLGWGSTRGAITSAVQRARQMGRRVSQLHLRHLNPFPRDLGEVLERYDRVLVPEINLGQLAFILQGRFAREVTPLNKVQGSPFKSSEILERILEMTEGGNA